MIWRWPTPGQVGLTLDAVEQERVVSVRADSPAARAGLRAGDRLLTIDGQRVLSGSDVSWALERARGGARALALAWTRGDARLEGALELAAGWEVGDALTLSWRPSKWQLVPSPGFGGPALSPDEKQRLGLAPATFALRVDYLVTWGSEARFGQAAQRAGVRKGDVVLGVNGRADFQSHDHFQAWWRLNLRPGDVARVELLRGGERRVAELTVLE
jgi:S1-C subfamily serine protease